MAIPTRFHPVGFDKQKLHALMQQHELGGILLGSPENVFFTTGYTALPSSGNPILYTLRNRLPFFSFMDDEGQVTLLCWGFSGGRHGHQHRALFAGPDRRADWR